jgi:hypothetical protein
MPRLTLSFMHATAVIMIAVPLVGATGLGLAQTRVKTETIRPDMPAVTAAPIPPLAADKDTDPAVTGAIAPRKPDAGLEILTDLARLPGPVAQTRERILAAARSGNIGKLVAIMRANALMPIFSLNNDSDPAAYWSANFPESAGLEILATLIEILETGFVHVDGGTSQELYLWPYFARVPLDSLTPEQKVELFRVVTGADYKDMLDFGAYNFYRLGIGPDGTWHFFVSGD